MAILNVTPDSFSDGGAYAGNTEAIDAALRMIDEGADLIDVGGESTRPGSHPVPEDVERARVIPVVERIASRGVAVSVDTSKPTVARDALQAGAQVINDVKALREPGMIDVCADSTCTVCLMHMQGEPATMQHSPSYQDVVAEVREFLLARASEAQAHGIARDRIWVDPGIGFGKTSSHNLALIRNLAQFVETGYPILLGVSRKGFIGRLLDAENPPAAKDRLLGSIALQAAAQLFGASVIRAHDVREARQVIDVLSAMSREGS